MPQWLTVPLQKVESKQLTKDLRISYQQHWQHQHWKAILSVAYYLIIEDSNPRSRFGRWSATHRHPFGEDIPSQRSSANLRHCARFSRRPV